MNKGRWYRGVLADLAEFFFIQRLCPRTLSRVEMDKRMMSSGTSTWEATDVCDDNVFAFELSEKKAGAAAEGAAGKASGDVCE